MKIQASVRRAFQEQLDLNKVLRDQVDPGMRALTRPRWHYECRLKEEESYAAKLETCRVSAPSALEDFLACMIVVPSAAEIAEAKERIAAVFDIKYQRPAMPTETKKEADSFPFDDVRLYCTIKNDGTVPSGPVDEVVFEVQVKTFLQHAWSMATHDLNYKTDEVSWGKDRVVAHLKAALEHVELSIQEATALSQSPAVNLTNPQTALLIDIIAILKARWVREDLPSNLRGLAQTIAKLLTALNLSGTDLASLLDQLSASQGGLPLDLSPYSVILTAILSAKTADLDKALKKASRPLVFVTPEIRLPTGFPSAGARKRVILLET